jgi:hypothetical protein
MMQTFSPATGLPQRAAACSARPCPAAAAVTWNYTFRLLGRPAAWLSVAAKISNQPCDLRFPGAIAQLEEHLLCKQGVRGSSPLSSTWGFFDRVCPATTVDHHFDHSRR